MIPVVFIHGFGGCGALWQWQVERFSPHRPVVAVDLPGHGRRPWQGEGLDAMADAVAGDLVSVPEGGADIVASSFGGLVALRLWERHPARVRRMVFAGALPLFLGKEDFPAGLDPARIRKLAGQFQGDIAGVLDMFFRSVVTMKERESAQYPRVRELRRGLPLPRREALLAVLDMLETADLRDAARRLDKPMLFMLGAADPICPVAVAEPLRRLCPAAVIEIYKGCGHFPFLTMPEVFYRRVARFLERP